MQSILSHDLPPLPCLSQRRRRSSPHNILSNNTSRQVAEETHLPFLSFEEQPQRSTDYDASMWRRAEEETRNDHLPVLCLL